MARDIKLGDFNPYNKWTSLAKQGIFKDQTGRSYQADNNSRWEFLGLATTGIVLIPTIHHLVAAIADVGLSVLKTASFYHFWKADPNASDLYAVVLNEETGGYEKPAPLSFKGRVWDAGKEVAYLGAYLLGLPLSVAALYVIPYYGMIRPLDGAKLYATIERLQFGAGVVEPQFQPLHMHTGNKHRHWSVHPSVDGLTEVIEAII